MLREKNMKGLGTEKFSRDMFIYLFISFTRREELKGQQICLEGKKAKS